MTGAINEGSTPLEATVARVLDSIRVTAEDPTGRLDCKGLIEVVGPKSHILAIMVFSVLNLLPGPPGYSVAIGLSIMAFAVMLLTGQPLRLWAFVGDRQIPLTILVKMLEFLAGFTRFVSKFSSPRLPALASSALLPLVAIMAFIVGTAMLLPIPFTNTLPSLGLAILCVGLLNDDGVAVIVGSTIALLGVFLVLLSLWILFSLGLFVTDVIQHDLPEL